MPTCLADSDAVIDGAYVTWCLRYVDSLLDFEGSRSSCGSVVQATDDVTVGVLYAADSSEAVEELASLAQSEGLAADFWVGRPTEDDVADAGELYVVLSRYSLFEFEHRPTLCSESVAGELTKLFPRRPYAPTSTPKVHQTYISNGSKIYTKNS